MPLLPIDPAQLYTRSDLPSARLPAQRASSADFGGAVADAISSLGDTGQRLAAHLQANAVKSEQFNTENQFIQLQDEDDQAYQQGVTQLSGTANGWWQQSRQATQQRLGEWLKTVPEGLREQYAVKASAFIAGRTKQAFHDQYQQQTSFMTSAIDEAQRKAELQVTNNPALYPQFVKQQLDFIDQSTLSPEKKLEAKRAAENSLAFQAEMARAKSNPATVAKSLAARMAPPVDAAIEGAAKEFSIPPEALRQLIHIESGGRPDAVNGSHKGLGQLTDEEFKKYGSGDIMNPADNARAMAAKLSAEATQFKAKYGRDPSTADLYLQYQQGVGGYAAHVAAPDNLAWRNMASTGEGKAKGDAWAKAAVWGNIPDDMKGRFPGGVDTVTSADFIKVWHDKLRTASEDTPATRALTGEQLARVQETAQRQMAHNEQQAQANAAAAKADKLNALYLDIQNGPAPDTALKAAIDDGLLSEYNDRKRAQSILDARTKQNKDLNLGVALMAGGKAVANQYDPSHKAGIDAYFANEVQKGAAPEAVAARVFDQTGLVPPAFALAIRGAVASNDTGRVQSAMNVAAGMLRQNPNAFVGVEGAAKLEEQANEYRRLTETMGLSPEQATAQILKPPQEKMEPVKQEQFQLFQKQNLTQAQIDGRLQKLFTSWNPLSDKPFSVGLPAGEQRTIMASIYADWAKQGYEKFRDVDKALSYADLRAQKQIGVQNGLLMVYPPSKSGLPRIADAADGYQWVNQQAAEEVLAQKGVKVDPSQIVLLPLEHGGYSTRAAFDGAPAHVKRKDGTALTSVPYLITVMPKTPDQEMLVLHGAFLPDMQSYLATHSGKTDAMLGEEKQAELRDSAVKARARGPSPLLGEPRGASPAPPSPLMGEPVGADPSEGGF